MTETKRGKGRLVKRLCIAAASLLLLFALIEIGFRVREHLQLAQAGEIWPLYDPVLGYRNNPRYEDHNEHGFRDNPLAPKSDETRIVILGDSVAYYGDDLDDTLPGHLRRALAEREETPCEVVNTAVRGWTNWQQVEFLKRSAAELEPDLVGVAFVLNDCHRILHAFRVVDGEIVGQDYDFSEEAVASVDSWLFRTLRRSRFLVWLRRRLDSLDAGTLVSDEGGYSFDYRPDFRNAWRDEPWQAVDAQLGELRALGEERGFASFVVVIPFGDQYREDYLARDRDYVLSPQRRLGEICARHGLPMLDLFPLLDPATELAEDGIHLTAAGRRRAAERIAEFLRSSGLLR
jgi:lysophospholipase L1-like esterase